MFARIIDMDKTDAFIIFKDGTTMDISLCRLPRPIKVGDIIDIPFETSNVKNDKMDTLL